MNTLKNIINWNYERASWQWDVLCLVCLVFIFLTPKDAFNKPNPLTNANAAVIRENVLPRTSVVER